MHVQYKNLTKNVIFYNMKVKQILFSHCVLCLNTTFIKLHYKDTKFFQNFHFKKSTHRR